MQVIYRGDTRDYQVKHSGCDDPRGVLTPGEAYTVQKRVQHGWRTRIYIDGKPYSAVHFDKERHDDPAE